MFTQTHMIISLSKPGNLSRARNPKSTRAALVLSGLSNHKWACRKIFRHTHKKKQEKTPTHIKVCDNNVGGCLLVSLKTDHGGIPKRTRPRAAQETTPGFLQLHLKPRADVPQREGSLVRPVTGLSTVSSKPMVPFWLVGAPTILETILLGIGMFTRGTGY